MRATLSLVVCAVPLLAACGDDSPPPRPVENAGQTCTSVSQCYPRVDGGTLQGEVVCMDKVPNGYCTHKCVADSDCCAVAGECTSGHPQVCAPFENQPEKYCLLSCEAAVLGSDSADHYCSTWAHADFGCRSSGGGTENRKICMP